MDRIVKRTPFKGEKKEYTAKIDERYKYFDDFIKGTERNYNNLSNTIDEEFAEWSESCHTLGIFQSLLDLRVTHVESLNFLKTIKIILDMDSNHDLDELKNMLKAISEHHVESMEISLNTHKLPFGTWLNGGMEKNLNGQTLH